MKGYIMKNNTIKTVMCGDDKTIPKSVHKKIKIYSDHFLDIDYDLKWKDAYAILSNFYKQGVEDGKKVK